MEGGEESMVDVDLSKANKKRRMNHDTEVSIENEQEAPVKEKSEVDSERNKELMDGMVEPADENSTIEKLAKGMKELKELVAGAEAPPETSKSLSLKLSGKESVQLAPPKLSKSLSLKQTD